MGIIQKVETTRISDLILTPLRDIDVPGGNVLHGLKASEKSFQGFGEAYFSKIEFKKIKAWKLHKKMTLNLIVPLGSVRFVFFDDRRESFSYQKFDEITISKDNFIRLTVPPKLWFGFQGLDKNINLVLNIANIEHDVEEVQRKNINEINYNWS